MDTDTTAWEQTPQILFEAIVHRAQDYYSEGRLDRSRELLEKAIKIRPGHGPSWYLLGVIHRREERLPSALICLQRAADIDPSDRGALVNLGESLILAGKVPEGVALLRALFEDGRDPHLPPAEQDSITRRAGAQLAILASLLPPDVSDISDKKQS